MERREMKQFSSSSEWKRERTRRFWRRIATIQPRIDRLTKRVDFGKLHLCAPLTKGVNFIIFPNVYCIESA